MPGQLETEIAVKESSNPFSRNRGFNLDANDLFTKTPKFMGEKNTEVRIEEVEDQELGVVERVKPDG